MATFTGMNTIHQHKKFTLTDFELIKRDLLNAFLIREGEIAGRPDLGTKIWSFIFEPLIDEVKTSIENEVRSVIGGDPRLELDSLTLYSNENVVIIETAVVVLPNRSVEELRITFDQRTNTVSLK